MAKKKFEKFNKPLALIILLILAILFLIKFGAPIILRIYIEYGIGTCQKIPVLCLAPSDTPIKPSIDQEYIQTLLPYSFPEISIQIPKGFNVVQEKIKKVYYKDTHRKDKESVAYLLHKDPDYFISIFPQVRRQGVDTDYEFLNRTMQADLKNIKTLTDAFFVIMKGIFIPDLGNQNELIMIKFESPNHRGFLNYRLGKTDNFFDCNVFDAVNNFFKIYIRDMETKLDLNKVFTIISTVRKPENNNL